MTELASKAIVTRGLTKVYKSLGARPGPSLEDLNLEISQNEVFGFLGRNGAGKTTTIKLLCSLLRPTRGEAFVFGESTRTARARRLIGYLPENPYFYEYLTPRETLDFYGRLQGMKKAAREAEWEKLSALLNLHDIADQRVRSFSKGMRQRLGFAVALVGDPPLLVLDEPMSGLDPMGRRAIRELIVKMRDEKKTIFFSSHVLSDVEQICDRIGILVKGKLSVAGRMKQLLTDKINLVEVVIAGINEAVAKSVAPKSESASTTEGEFRFRVANLDAANELVHETRKHGGHLIEFTPVKESLEDYFVREQGPTS